MFVGCLSRTVPRRVRMSLAGWQRRSSPENAGVLITNEDGFARRIANGVVRPRGEAVVVTVPRPGESSAAFRRRESKHRVRDNIDPRGRRKRVLLRMRTAFLIDVNDVFTSVVGEAADPVEDFKFGGRWTGKL